MRHATVRLFSILLLGFLGASSASAGVYSYVIGQSTGESNARYEEQQKARSEGRISCVPQLPSSDNLWKCEDAYGNQYENLVITLKSEIENLKGKKMAAGLGWPKPDPKSTPIPPKKP
jgi:hypothetical protein